MQVKETGGQNQVPSDSIAENELFLHHEAELNTTSLKLNTEDVMQVHGGMYKALVDAEQ